MDIERFLESQYDSTPPRFEVDGLDIYDIIEQQCDTITAKAFISDLEDYVHDIYLEGMYDCAFASREYLERVTEHMDMIPAEDLDAYLDTIEGKANSDKVKERW